jgi:hypothetical protein
LSTDEAQLGFDFPILPAAAPPPLPIKLEPETCRCGKPIADDDVFGKMYGEHKTCFDEFPF